MAVDRAGEASACGVSDEWGDSVFRYLDFFAGAGLVDLALRPQWQCVWANDIDPCKAEVYRANIPGDHFVLGDVADVNAVDLPLADMAWASFPCQDLSLAGWRRGMSAERSGTFWAFWRIMRDQYDAGQRPPLIVIENVVGLLYGDNLAGLCEALAALDMRFGALVIDARWFVPQSRPRVFIVAVDAAFDPGDLASDMPESSVWTTGPVNKAWLTLPERLRSRWLWWRLPVPATVPPAIDRLIEDEPSGVAWHSAEETLRLLDLMSPAHVAKIREAQATAGRSVGFLYKRTRRDGQRAEVRFDGVAGCLRTPSGGSSRQTVVIIDEGRVRSRLLSPREAARLMGVPDWFQLPARYNDAYHAMGDGVAVPAVAWLSEHILTPVAGCMRQAAAGNCVVHRVDLLERVSREAAENLAEQWALARG